MSPSIHMQSYAIINYSKLLTLCQGIQTATKLLCQKFLTNKIKLTWTTTPLVAEGWEAGGVSGEWGFLQANCLDLINQSYWTIQMKTNGLGCLLWLPHMQQCVGRSIAFWGLQLKNREILQTTGQPHTPILCVSRLVNFEAQSERTY